ncbi:MAG TPA: hypothetical protein VMF68_01905 [Spirochaetia bacterium]|nr:hypothetical protein [Spirochaetia bacterium]
MNVRSVPLIAGPRRGRPDVPDTLLEELHRLQERRGEMIAAVDQDTGSIAGTLGLFPDRDEGGKLYHLAGLQVAPAHTGQDIDVFLLEAAGGFLAARRVTRLKFGTSPLLTHAAWLYVNRFGTRYRWREGSRTPAGRPWPYVACECDFDDPLDRPLDLRDEEVPDRCLVSWESGRPVMREDLRFSGPLCVALPDLDSEDLSRLSDRQPEVIAILHDAFRALHLHGYEFAWFDRLAGAARPGGASWYYLMKRVVSL